MSNFVLITGASSGVGFATLSLLLEKKYQVIAISRNISNLKKINTSNMQVYSCDVGDYNSVENFWNSLDEKIKEKINVIINNAGVGKGRGPFYETSLQDWEEMINTNLKGVIYLTHKLLPYFIKRKDGHIINVGSVAGIEGYPKGGVYVATKHGVRGFSNALRYDLSQYGIRVTHIAPGIIKTDFHIKKHRDEKYVSEIFAGFTPLYPEDVAKAILFAMEMPPHVCISEIVIYPTKQVTPHLIYRES